MAILRKAFVDADIWINLSLVGQLDLLFSLYTEIYMAREVATEIANFYDPEPYKLFGKKIKANQVKVIDLEDDFSSLTIELIKRQRKDYEFKIGFIVNGTKNLGEFASVQYANELGIKIFMSDDKQAKLILENDFGIMIRDHCDLLIEAEEVVHLIKTPQADSIYNALEGLKDKPSENSYAMMKKLRHQL